MQLEAMMPYLIQAGGGVIGANLLGLITRGGGGLVGRTLIGALAGLGAGYAAETVEAVGNLARNWSALMPEPNGARLANLITGAAGGGLLGLITGLLIRPR